MSLHLRPIAAVLALAWMLSATPTSLHSQTRPQLFGAFGMSYMVPTGGFTAIDGMPSPNDPLSFTPDGNAFKPWFHVGADLAVNGVMRLGLRAGMSWYDLSYNAREEVTIATPDGGSRRATLGHDLTTSITAFSIEPVIRFRMLDHVAFDIGLPFLFPVSDDYLQTQRFVDPSGLPFVDGTVEQVTGQGPIPGMASVAPAVTAAVEGTLPITEGGGLLLTPRLSFGYQIGSWHTERSLRQLSIGLGIGLRFDPFVASGGPVRDTIFIRDTLMVLSTKVQSRTTELMSSSSETFNGEDTIRVVVKESYRALIPKPPAVLEASVNLSFEGADGTVSNEAQIQISTVEQRTTIPLVPVVIFDNGSAVIPDRYVRLTPQSAATWRASIQARRESGPHWQYHIMNTMGSRMRDRSESRLSLVAMHDGTDQGAAMAVRRAQAVKDYVTSTFGLDPARITITDRKGQEAERSWVVFQDEMRATLQPMVRTDTIIETRLPHILITPDVISEEGVMRWRIQMAHMGEFVDSLAGTGDIPDSIKWDPNGKVDPNAVLDTPVMITLSVVDGEGATAESTPGRVSVKGPMATHAPGIDTRRDVVLRLSTLNSVSTPDADLFKNGQSFTRIDVYPASDQPGTSPAFKAPTVRYPVGAPAWFRVGLQGAEAPLYRYAEVYVKEERRN